MKTTRRFRPPVAVGQYWAHMDRRYAEYRYLTVEEVTETSVVVRGRRGRKSTFRLENFGLLSTFMFCGYNGAGLLPPYTTHEFGCLHAGAPEEVLPLSMELELGFGVVEVTRDGKDAWHFFHTRKRLAHIECRAQEMPGDWRIFFNGPMRGTMYQRHAPRQWVLVGITMGFA